MCWMIASSILSPATRTEREKTTPASEITATSVVPPPISTIMLPEGSVIGSPAPIAAAIGSSIRYTTRAPAASAASRSALFDPTARGGADHETRVDEITAVVGLLNELAQHAF